MRKRMAISLLIVLVSAAIDRSAACMATCPASGSSVPACATCDQSQPTVIAELDQPGFTNYGFSSSNIATGQDSNCCSTKRFTCYGLDASIYFNEAVGARGKSAEVFSPSDCNDFPDAQGNTLNSCTAVLTCDANSTWTYYSTLHNVYVHNINTIVCSKSVPNT